MKGCFVDRRSALILISLLAVFLPSVTLAQDFSFGLSPTQIEILDFVPGQAAEFELLIRNKCAAPQIFTLTAFQPAAHHRKDGWTALPDPGWISFFPAELELPAGAQSQVTIVIAIPAEKKWAGKNWEVWLGVTAESEDTLGIQLNARLFVSTSGAASKETNVRLIAAVAAGLLLLICAARLHHRRSINRRYD